MALFPSFGGASYSPTSRKVIRFILKGCVNRPFFHISVQEFTKEPYEPVIEQLGSYDPLPNVHNEKLVAINFKRLEHWIRNGATVTEPVAQLLGLCGYFPVHVNSLIGAYERRKKIGELLEKLKIQAAELESSADETSRELSNESISLEEEPGSIEEVVDPNKNDDKDSKS